MNEPEYHEHETGPFTWRGDENGRAFGVAFPDGSVVMLWDRRAWPEEDRLDNEHLSIYGSVGDVLHAFGGKLYWGEWNV